MNTALRVATRLPVELAWLAVLAVSVRSVTGHGLPDYPFGTLLPTHVLVLSTFLIGIALAWGVRSGTGRAEWVAVRLLGIALATILAKLLEGTLFAPHAISGDPGFHTAMVTKFAHYWRPVDFNYAELPAYYPPLYHYTLGKLSWLLGRAPFTMIKLGLLISAYLLPLGLYALARKLLPPICAFLLVAALLLVDAESFLNMSKSV